MQVNYSKDFIDFVCHTNCGLLSDILNHNHTLDQVQQHIINPDMDNP